MAGAVIRISGDFDDSALNKASLALSKFGLKVDDVSKSSNSSFSGIKTSTIAIGSAIGTALGGVATEAIGKLAGAFKGAFDEAAQYQSLAAKTAAVIKSTGDAANISVKGVQGLAASLESMSGVDELLITNGENVLATFTGIRNEAGKGNDIFNQATKAALNVSTALGQDMQSSAIQLGKALNDPIKGITALSRVGVSFTQQQKDQIKALQSSGNMMGAQKVILAELNKEFGGAAAAAGSGFAGSMARAKDAVTDAMRGIALGLLPILTKLAVFFVNDIMPALQNAGKQFMAFIEPVIAQVIPILKQVGTVVMNIVSTVFPPLMNILEGIVSFYKGELEGALSGLKLAWGYISDALEKNKKPLTEVSNFLVKLEQILSTVLKPVLTWLGKFLGETLKIAFEIIGKTIGVVINVIGFIVAAIGTFSSGLVALKNVAVGVFDGIKGFVDGLWDKLTGFAKSFASLASTIFTPLYNGFKAVLNTIIGAWNALDFGIHIHVPSWVPLVGGKGFDINDIFPDIPYLASGGIVTSPTLAMIGEAGPEAVIPLGRGGGGFGGITVAAGAVQVSIGSMDGMGRSQIQAIVDEAFSKSMTQLAREMRAR